VAKRVLERAVVAVIEASNGVEGLAQLQLHPEVSLVITDVVMPRMSGLQMLQQMNALGLHPAVLVTSGYTEETLVHHGNVPAEARYLDKPFTGEALLEAARSALHPHTGELAYPRPAATDSTSRAAR
jgi:YesN/AraC family two-component response regulator